jgi:MOSC domain-containing protein YiiM
MIRHIFVAPLKGAPASASTNGTAFAGQGLEGDRYAEARNRTAPDHEVTFIELEAIEAFTRATNLAMTPAMPRRNIVTEGVRLNALVGKRFRVGEAVFEGLELCEPCGKFARRTHREALKFFVGRGGLRARIVAGGVVKVGDALELAETPVRRGGRPARSSSNLPGVQLSWTP